MVVFACNVCNESMKKAQVERHYFKCRQCNVLSCVDCGKEFWGNDYQQHTKCMTEDEKYGGKNYKPKPGANKGELKQELWIQQVQEAINNAQGNAKLRGLLERIKDYPNIPRKKVKFENFVRNSFRVHEQWLIDQVWEAMAANIQKPAAPDPPKNGDENKNGKAESQTADAEPSKDTSGDATEQKKSKREKKEERSKKQTKKQKKGKVDEDAEEKQPKKSKKRKRDEEDDDVEESVEPIVKKKKKKRRDQDEEDENQDDALDTSQSSVMSPVKPTKFSWEQCILEVLRKNENEIKIKKLRKKVLSEYVSCCGGEASRKSDEQLWAKFEKKVRHTNGLKIQKERVKLIES